MGGIYTKLEKDVYLCKIQGVVSYKAMLNYMCNAS